MSDIRYNSWYHRSGTGGVHQASNGRVGIGSTIPQSTLDLSGGTLTATEITGVSTIGVTTVTANTLNVGLTTITSDGVTTVTANTLNVGLTTITSDSLQVNGTQYPSVGPLSNRNLIINGDMRIAQRGTGPVTKTTDGEHLLDRIRGYSSSNNTYSIDHSQSTDVPSGQGFKYSYKYEVSANAAATPNNGYVVIGQRIEGYNTDQLRYGTANAKTVTVSFWVKSSEAGTYTFAIRNGNFNFSYATEFSIQNDDTWEFIEKTIPGPSTGTWLDENNIGLEVLIGIDVGSDFYNASLNTWASNNHFGSSGATNTWSDTLNNEFYVTGLQLEVGNKATPFEHRSFGDELEACRRYFWSGVVRGSAVQAYAYRISMRTTPASSTTTGSGAIVLTSKDVFLVGSSAAQNVTVTVSAEL